jgi:hypothetical protein
VIGYEAVSRAAPDGNTLMVMGTDTLIPPHLRKLNFDLLTGFEPICYLVSAPTVIAVNTASPYRTLGDLLNAARARPGELTVASVGPASALQIAFETLKRAANVNMTFVPYPGVAPAINSSVLPTRTFFPWCARENRTPDRVATVGAPAQLSFSFGSSFPVVIRLCRLFDGVEIAQIVTNGDIGVVKEDIEVTDLIDGPLNFASRWSHPASAASRARRRFATSPPVFPHRHA